MIDGVTQYYTALGSYIQSLRRLIKCMHDKSAWKQDWRAESILYSDRRHALVNCEGRWQGASHEVLCSQHYRLYRRNVSFKRNAPTFHTWPARNRSV